MGSLFRPMDAPSIAWDEVFSEHRVQLMLASRALLPTSAAAEAAVEEARASLDGQSVAGRFCFSLALRTVVQVSLRRAQGVGGVHSATDAAHDPFAALPLCERAVYFLRDVLGYALRDVALLLNMGDRQAETLLGLARRRLAVAPSDLAPAIAAYHDCFPRAGTAMTQA